MAVICGIPIQTLRYYDKTGLLHPEKTDPESGYRYYSGRQVLQVKIIQSLRDMDFSIRTIKDYLPRDNLEVTAGIFEKKLAEIHDEIKKLDSRKKIIEERLFSIRHFSDGKNNGNIEYKEIPERTVLFTRRRSAATPECFIERYNELQNIMRRKKLFITDSFMAIFHDHYTKFDPLNADYEVCVPVKNVKKEASCIRTIPGGYFLSLIHKGPYRNAPESYAAMLSFTEENNYTITGPAIEIYLVDIFATTDENEFLTELQLPVNKNT